MAGRIILFGATGYTGRLTAESLARRAAPNVVLAGRNEKMLGSLADELDEAHDWECDTATADIGDIGSVQDLVHSPRDVLISTVGPYVRFGKPAIEAATATGAVYIDSTGEPPFVRRVFDRYGPRAKRTGASLLTAFGYDYVPGNLAGLLALRKAEAAGFVPSRVDIGYFLRLTDPSAATLSAGTLASSMAVIAEPSFAFANSEIIDERPARHVRQFDVDGTPHDALSVGGTEHYTLPRIDPRLTDVRVYIGWAGGRTRQLSAAARVINPVTRLPLVRQATRTVTGTLVTGSGGGPSAADRARAKTVVLAEAYLGDAKVASVTVSGPSPYELTADLLAWAAESAMAGGLGSGRKRRSGALGPADGFGEEEFIAGCRSLGLAASA